MSASAGLAVDHLGNGQISSAAQPTRSGRQNSVAKETAMTALLTSVVFIG